VTAGPTTPPVRDHHEVGRAGSFGVDADRYERVRPGYPAALVADLAPRGDEVVLDIGCGTGKATALFAAAGCDVLGLDPDARMAAIARARGLRVELGSFEAWDAKARTFDIVTAAQAWHWVDPAVAPNKAAGLLPAGGLLAPVWNYRFPADAEQLAAFRAVYARLEPELLLASPLLGTVDGEAELVRHAGAITACAAFPSVETRRYDWQVSYSAVDWLELARTQSDHRILGEERLERLLAAIGAELARLGADVPVNYQSVALLAVRQ
jgi:SAM-dependent methyltransferase